MPVHYFTGSGSLCGVLVVQEWTIARTSVTCPKCRALLCLTVDEIRRTPEPARTRPAPRR